MTRCNTLFTRVFCFLMMLSMLLFTLPQEAHAADPTIIRILDGRITTQALWDAFDGGKSGWSNSFYTHYRYRKADETTGWKRVDGDDLSDLTYAENIVSGVPFTVLRSQNLFNSGDWKPYGTFQFQTYYNIGVTLEGSIPSGGGVQISGGTLSNGLYQVNENANLTLKFTPVSGYDAQVQVNGTEWKTVDPSTNVFNHKAEYSTSLKYCYIQSDPSKKRITVTVNDPLLGTYSGIENDQMSASSTFRLIVMPYNEKTGTNDQDAYVKSVKINGSEVTGTYANTVLTLPAHTVTDDVTINIEFAKRLVLKAPTVSIQKYEGDPYTMEYSAKMNMDKAVSEQIPAIEDSILESVVDVENTAGYDRKTVKVLVEAVLNLGLVSYDGCMEMSSSISDLEGIGASAINSIFNLFGSSNWGDCSFGNNGETWENIRISMPGSDRYPAVESELLTVVISEARTTLTIGGTAAETVVESQANIDAAVKAAVRAKILSDNTAITEPQLNASGITYTYTVPAFDSLSPNNAANVVVSVNIPKSDLCLQSTGNITVPLKRSSIEPSLTVEDDGNGTISYIRDGYTYTLIATPTEGYYVSTLELTTTPFEGTPASSTIARADMTAQQNDDFTYTYALTVQDNYSYHVKAQFTRFSLVASAVDGTFAYYDGLYATTDDLVAPLESEITTLPAAAPYEEALPDGIMTYEYLARVDDSTQSDVWLTVGTVFEASDDTASPYYGCHQFGDQTTEKLRCRYTFTADGFTLLSNTVNLALMDERISTVVRLNTPDAIDYADYAQMTASDMAALLLEGVYAVDESGQETLMQGVMPVFTPALDQLRTDEVNQITATYPGSVTHKSSSATTTQTINPIPASVTVNLDKNVIQYGDSYTVGVETTPANLGTIQFIAGVDISNLKLADDAASSLITDLTLLAPADLAANLQNYLTNVNTDDQLTLKDLYTACDLLKDDDELLAQYGISRASLLAVEQIITMFGSPLTSTPLHLSTDKPANIGFYLVGAVISEDHYETAVGLNYLLIAPKHYQVELGWENEITGAIGLDDLTIANLLDAKVVSVQENGSVADATQELGWLFISIGLNQEQEQSLVTTTKQSELLEGTYIQVACTTGWGNVRYSCLPILREIVVASDMADVAFLNADGEEIVELVMQSGEQHGVTLNVTYSDGTPIPQEKLDQFLKVIYFTLDGTYVSAVSEITQSGLYMISATYKEPSVNGGLGIAGSSNLLLLLTQTIDGFTVSDNTVAYDSAPHFVTIADTNDPTLTYISIVVDKEGKQINILLPEAYDKLEEIIELANSTELGAILEYLDTLSPEGTIVTFIRGVLQRISADIQFTTGYTVTFGGDLPVNPGEYYVYVGVSGNLQVDNDSDSSASGGEGSSTSDTGLMIERALLTITKSQPVIVLQYTDDPDKLYDGQAIHDPIKDTDYTITGAYKGTEIITWYQQVDGSLVKVNAPVEVGTYTVSVELEATAWNEATSDIQTDIVISPKDIAGADITLGDSLTYNGKPQTQTIASVTVDGLPVSYTVSGNTNTDAGEYILTITGAGNFTGTATKAYSIAPRDIAGTKVVLEYDSILYSGTAHTPAVTSASVGSLSMTQGKDFTVTYTSNVNPGAAQVILTGKGNFAGSASASFLIYKENEYLVIVTGGSGSGSYKAGATVRISANQHEGKLFTGWTGAEGLVFTQGSATMPVAVFTMPDRNVMLTAGYADILPETFTVRFDANGGGGSMTDVTGVTGAYILPDCAFTAPAGQQFVGWRINGSDYALDDTIVITADTLVTACWKPLSAPGSAPVICSPTESQTIALYVSEQTTLRVVAENAQRYQWCIDRGDGRGPVPVSGAVSASYTTTPAVLKDNGYVYSCTVSNEYGSVQTPAFRLIVLSEVEIPSTGDDTPIALWCMMLVVCLLGLALLRRRYGSIR